MTQVKQHEIDDFEQGNMIYSCHKHGRQIYFNIKKMEKMTKTHVYVWFKQGKKQEKMWVKITKGNQKKGEGTLDNDPQIITNLQHGQLIRYETDKEGITYVRGTKH